MPGPIPPYIAKGSRFFVLGLPSSDYNGSVTAIKILYLFLWEASVLKDALDTREVEMRAVSHCLPWCLHQRKSKP